MNDVHKTLDALELSDNTPLCSLSEDKKVLRFFFTYNLTFPFLSFETHTTLLLVGVC